MSCPFFRWPPLLFCLTKGTSSPARAQSLGSALPCSHQLTQRNQRKLSQLQRTRVQNSEHWSFSVSCQNQDASVLLPGHLKLVRGAAVLEFPGLGSEQRDNRERGGVGPRKSPSGSFMEPAERSWPLTRRAQAPGLLSLSSSRVNMLMTMLGLTTPLPQLCRLCQTSSFRSIGKHSGSRCFVPVLSKACGDSEGNLTFVSHFRAYGGRSHALSVSFARLPGGKDVAHHLVGQSRELRMRSYGPTAEEKRGCKSSGTHPGFILILIIVIVDHFH